MELKVRAIICTSPVDRSGESGIAASRAVWLDFREIMIICF